MYGGILLVFGVHPNLIKEDDFKKSTLYVCNHISFLDILVLGSQIPGCFVSKAEVAKWPFVGFFAWLTGTIFVDRTATNAAKQLQQMQNHLIKGRSLILFPEGTSTQGHSILPFKSSFFKLVELEALKNKMHVQPLNISYNKCYNTPLRYHEGYNYYFIGDMDVLGILRNTFKLGKVVAEISVKQHLQLESSKHNRKLVAKQAHKAVAN